ncbi:MAG TPA: uridine kinase [Blastocatellia bacterium]|nr:uridine kinase [Blastocatellia bacterium]
MNRSQALRDLADRMIRINLTHPTRVAIDGVDAVGKTTLADELATIIEASDRNVIRASVDGFHNPARIRYQRGADSAEGYYRDSFNLRMVIEVLLEPLGPEGSRGYRSAIFDYRTDREIDQALETADEQAVLLFDGVFLHRPELREHFDFTVFVDAAFEVTLSRAIQRGGFGPSEDGKLRNRYEQRYIPGQRLYLNEFRPKDRADAVFDNTEIGHPSVAYREETVQLNA